MEEFYTVITGASKGIGKAFAGEMASRGRNLVLHSLPGEGLSVLCDEIAVKYNVKVIFLEGDLTEKKGPLKLHEFIRERSLKVNFLINNAGVGYDGCLESHSAECIDRMIFLNIRAMTMLTYLLTPELKKAPDSFIVNVSSFGGYVPTAFKSIYLSTKSYIYFFTRALRSEFRGSTIKASVILPGAVKTNEKLIKRIEASGFLAKVTALETEELARNAIRRVLKGRTVIIEGKLNRILFAIATITPEGIMLNVVKNVFKNREIN